MGIITQTALLSLIYLTQTQIYRRYLRILRTPNMEMMYYPEYNMDDTDREETSSFFSANSSAYDTPKSLTALQAASGLMAKYNQTQKIRKHSKSKQRKSKSRD